MGKIEENEAWMVQSIHAFFVPSIDKNRGVPVTPRMISLFLSQKGHDSKQNHKHPSYFIDDG